MNKMKALSIAIVGTAFLTTVFQNCGMPHIQGAANTSSNSPYVNSIFSGLTRNSISAAGRQAISSQNSASTPVSSAAQIASRAPSVNTTVTPAATVPATQSACFTNADGVCNNGPAAPAPVISVSNSEEGPFVVNGTVCNSNKGKIFIRTTNAKGITAGCIARAGVKECEVSNTVRDMYRGFNSSTEGKSDFLNESTIQTSMDAANISVGSYDVYVRGFFVAGLDSRYQRTPPISGTFKVVDSCAQVASTNQSAPITQVSAAPQRAEPGLQAASGNMRLYMSNFEVIGGQFDKRYDGSICNQGKVYAYVWGAEHGYGLRACVTPAGTAGCNDISKYHVYDDNELPEGYHPTATTVAEASIFTKGKYDFYLAYSAKSITKFDSFTVKSCTPERGCDDLIPRCEGKDLVHRNTCKEVDRIVDQPYCVQMAEASAARMSACSNWEAQEVKSCTAEVEYGRITGCLPPLYDNPTIWKSESDGSFSHRTGRSCTN